ncbi:MAG: propionate catabolism operon regulatory protein PrpR [Comamonas sp.]|jgi:propionate catabolism operon transcriptional regulator|uniref:propionate catabolism operon regulatory protein PrpR n=1 Tax=Comamonas sp. TaxID=34028 RepID=UPI00281A32FC|nr:propionate catabolism operon regulatory protein PrpR [Comamonas sp.]MDR0216133.1 propionate catabolism operon regulatory protein PrpR [Comamonas sp.]
MNDSIAQRTERLLLSEAQLPHIVTVGRYRIGRVLQRLAQLWSGQARFSHITASFDDAVAQIQALHRQKPIDALVGAGASGAWIRERVDMPLAMVEVRGLDLMQALRQAKLQTTQEQPHVGLVMFEQPSAVVAQFDQLFGLGLVQIAYQGTQDAMICVQKLKAAGVGAVVAPGLVADLAEQLGMSSVLMYSDISVRQALSDAMQLARHRHAERDRHQRLETVLGQLQDGVLAVDERGRICALNSRMAALLGAPVEVLHDRLLVEVAPALDVSRALAGGEIGEEVVQLAMRTLVVRRGPIVENGSVTGALLVCRDPAVIQRADRSLRANQSQRGAGVRWRIDDYLGSSHAAQRVRQLARQFAASDATVLILGESGTGKELVAQGIHRASRRAAQPFLAVNCAALSESLLESELFGYEEGSFTGARRGGKTGLIEAAHTGTLFLDEIGDMPLALQSRLLRVLQEREVLRVGSTTPVPVDVRVIAATHADLTAQVERGQFRRDLYYRLAVLRLSTPSLRTRGAGDVAELARSMLARHLGLASAQALEAPVHKPMGDLLAAVLGHAAAHDWPGNVRELDNWVERLLACHADLRTAEDGSLDASRLQEIFPECAPLMPLATALAASRSRLRDTRREAERQRVREVMDSVGGDQGRACEILGISRATLWRRMKA